MYVIGSISQDYADYDYRNVSGLILEYGVGSNVWDIVGVILGWPGLYPIHMLLRIGFF